MGNLSNNTEFHKITITRFGLYETKNDRMLYRDGGRSARREALPKAAGKQHRCATAFSAARTRNEFRPNRETRPPVTGKALRPDRERNPTQCGRNLSVRDPLFPTDDRKSRRTPFDEELGASGIIDRVTLHGRGFARVSTRARVADKNGHLHAPRRQIVAKALGFLRSWAANAGDAFTVALRRDFF